jgi:hypothetical protein
MSIEDVPNAPKNAPALWLKRSGLSGKLLAAGGALGVVAAFLPLMSISSQMMGMMAINRTASVVDAWQGVIGLIAYLACLGFSWLLYPPDKPPTRGLCWSALGACAIVGVTALWLLIATSRSSGGVDMMGMGELKASMGVGCIVNVLAAAAVVTGGLFKGREERLF